MKNQKVCNEEATVERIRATEDQTRDGAVPPWHKSRSHKGPMTEKRQWKVPECNNGIKDRGTATSGEGEDIQQDLQEDCRAGDQKQKVESSIGIWDVNGLDIMKGSVPSETKERTSKAQPSEMKKWQYACRLFGTNSLKDRHREPLLRIEHKTRNYTTAIPK
jgi:hypothetical protein